MPSTLLRLGLMGKMVPPKGCSSRLRKTVRPTLAGFSVAPITATVRGRKMQLRELSDKVNAFYVEVDSLIVTELLATGLLASGNQGTVSLRSKCLHQGNSTCS